MAEIPNSGFAMGFANQPETSDFVALDIGNVAIAAANKDSNPNSTSSPRVTKSFSRKGSLRVGGGGENKAAAAAAIEGDSTAFPISGEFLCNTGGAHAGEKQALSVHVACPEDPVSVFHVMTPTAAGAAKYRRLGSRRSSAPWLGPRRVLFVFATLSSMGTLILLYFTISMAKMSGGDANAR